MLQPALRVRFDWLAVVAFTLVVTGTSLPILGFFAREASDTTWG